jgi:hypothetical protein
MNTGSVFIYGSVIAQAGNHRLPTAATRISIMWDLWWTKWHWDIFPSSISLALATYDSSDCSIIITIIIIIIIIIYHPGLVQYVN